MPAGIPVGTLAIGRAGAINAALDILSALAALRNLAVRPAAPDADGLPTSLVVRVAPGSYITAAGARSEVNASGTEIAVPASTTTYIWLTAAGAVTSGAALPTAGQGQHVPLARVVAGTSAVTSIADLRYEHRLQGS